LEKINLSPFLFLKYVPHISPKIFRKEEETMTLHILDDATVAALNDLFKDDIWVPEWIGIPVQLVLPFEGPIECS